MLTAALTFALTVLCEALISEDTAASLQQKAGLIISKAFANAREAAACKVFWEELWSKYEAATGRKLSPAQKGTRKARALYQYGFPGQGKSSGDYYKRLEDGSCVKDETRNKGVKLLKELKKKGESNIAGGERLTSSGELWIQARATIEAQRAELEALRVDLAKAMARIAELEA